jgi:hypothetical protein
MTPTQQRAEFKRMTLKLVDLERMISAQRQGNVAFCIEILTALGLPSTVHDGMRHDILAEIKHLKAIEAAVVGK